MPWTPRSKVGTPVSAAGFGQGSGQSASPCDPPALSRSPGKPKGRDRLCCWARGALPALPLARRRGLALLLAVLSW